MKARALLQRIQFNRTAIPAIVAFSTLLLTAIAVYYLNATARNNDNLRFNTAVQQIPNTIRERFQTYTALLYAGRGLFATRQQVTKQDFHAFAAQLKLRSQYPGIQGIGFSQRVTPAEKTVFIAQKRLQGQAFDIHPDYNRDEYHIILYLEPLDTRNRAALGYDMFTESVRHSAMERARDTGDPVMSGRVTLKQEIDQHKQAGFLIYLPIYKNGAIPTTTAKRRTLLQGFIYCPFRGDDFIQGIFGDRSHALVDIQIYDGTEIRPDSLLHRSDRHSSAVQSGFRPKYRTTTTLNVAGYPWTLVFTSRPELEQISEQRFIPFIILLGGLISFILFNLTRLQVQARLTAERAAKQLRQSEKALRQANMSEQQARKEAEAANRSKDEFLAVLSHELRTPLTPILGWAKLLQVGKYDSVNLTQALKTIEQNAKLLSQLIGDLLDISRILQGKLTLNLASVDLAKTITAAVATMQLSAEEKSIQIHTFFEPSLTIVQGDVHRLQQVLWNLLSNAIKFTPQGRRVDIRLEEKSIENNSDFRKLHPMATTCAQITVADTGKGFSPELRPYLFDSFWQEDSKTTRQFGGLGLGLAIARQLTELHGGTIQADSPGEGQGSTFTLCLPLASSCQLDPAQQDGSGSIKLNGVDILLVDDEADMREFLAVMLKSYGANVQIASSAIEAFALFQKSQPDVLVSDIAMPEMNGHQLIQQIRRLSPEQGGIIPAIALTALAGEIDQQQAFAAGFQKHIPKPLEPAMLLQAIVDLTIG